MNYADVEKGIAALGQKAKNNQIAVEDMDGGTFTISNGGVFGSLFGTPIINPPQSSILGMHGVFERPVVRNGQVRYVKYKNNNTNIRVLKKIEGYLENVLNLKNGVKNCSSMSQNMLLPVLPMYLKFKLLGLHKKKFTKSKILWGYLLILNIFLSLFPSDYLVTSAFVTFKRICSTGQILKKKNIIIKKLLAFLK